MASKGRKVQRGKPLGASRSQQEKRALLSLGEKRRPFEPLLQKVVEAVLGVGGLVSPTSTARRQEDAPGGHWVEVGSGLGQLRSLLPPKVRARVTHTELSASLVRGLVARYPDAHALAADVAELPFESASVEAVLGLCAFDSFSAPASAAREVNRVLTTGGRFVHFLDATTDVEPLLVELVKFGRLPLPHFLADVALRQPSLIDQVGSWHLVAPLEDVLSVPFAQFSVVTEMLQKAKHPIAATLCDYAAVFCPTSFQRLSAARTFVSLTSDAARARPMNQALMGLYSTLKSPRYSQVLTFDLKSHSTLSGFKSKLEHYFGPSYGFEVRLSDIVYARSFEPNRDNPVRAQVRRVGSLQNHLNWPQALGTQANELMPSDVPSNHLEAGPNSHVLKEAAVYCLIAEKRRACPS